MTHPKDDTTTGDATPEPNPEDVILAGDTGDPAVIGQAQHSTNPVLRILALGAAHRSGTLTDETLTAALADPDRDVRCRAIELAVATPLDLITLLDDEDDLVVETTAWALGEREDASGGVVPALVRVGTSHDVSICREAAIAALGAIGDPAGLPAILAGMEDRAPVRRRAVLALAPFDGPEVDAAFERALEDRDRQVRQAAEDLR